MATTARRTGPEPARAARRWLRRVDASGRRRLVVARIVVGIGLVVGLMLAVAVPLGAPAPSAMVGAIVVMLAAMTTPRDGAREQWAHAAWLATFTGASAAVAALVSDLGVVPYATLLGVMAVGAWAVETRPTAFPRLMAAFMGHVIVLYLGMPAGAAPWLVVGALAGGAGSGLLITVALPTRPGPDARRLRRALVVHADHAVRTVARLSAREPGRWDRRLAHRALSRMQHTALELDARLAGLQVDGAGPDVLRDRALGLEVLVDQLASTVLADDAEHEPRPGLRELILGAWEGRAPEASASAAGPRAARLADLAARAASARDEVAAAGLAVRRARWAPPEPEEEAPETAEPPAPAAGRRIAQALVAGSAAAGLGALLSERYWYWAVIGAFIVLVTTPTRGAGLRKALDRTVGTALGAAVGLALAWGLGAATVEVALLAVAALAAVWLMDVSYVGLMFAITVAITLVYDLFQGGAEQMAWYRLVETALGAGVGGLVGYVLLPRSTRELVDRHVQGVLVHLDAVLALVPPGDEDAWALERERIRRLDAAVAELFTATDPLVPPGGVGSGQHVRAARLLAASARFRARTLLTSLRADPAEHDDSLAEAVAALRARVAGLQAALAGEPADGARPPRVDHPRLAALDRRLRTYQQLRDLARERRPEPVGS